jgi:hypothetical protein
MEPEKKTETQGDLRVMRSVTLTIDRESVVGSYEKFEIGLHPNIPAGISTRDEYEALLNAAEELVGAHIDKFTKMQVEKVAKTMSRTIPMAKPAPVYTKPPPASNTPPPRTQKGIEWIPWKNKPDIGARANIDSEEAESYANFLKVNGHISNQTKLDTEDGWGCWYAPGSGEYGPCLMKIRMNVSRGD